MDLKNATAVCLISFFSATLVVLIARALDLQAASKLEPQLKNIAEQLQALRSQGGMAAATDVALDSGRLKNGLMVYYFHSKIRCATCEAIESQSQETVQSDFASQLAGGDIAWKTLNYEAPEVAQLAKEFEIQMPVVVLARMRGGEIAEWKRLDKVWALVGDKRAFKEFVRSEINNMLPSAGSQASAESENETTKIPAPTVNSKKLPVPSTTRELPIPE